MGSGIAQVAATAGFTTLLFDVNEDAVQKAEERLQKDLATLVENVRRFAAGEALNNVVDKGLWF